MDQSIVAAVAALDAPRAVLADRLAGLDVLPVEDQLVLTRRVETVRNRVLALDLPLLAGLDRADAANRACQGNLRRLLTATLLISRGEAARRVHLYEQCGPRQTMLGETLEPVRPVLAEAVRAGEVSAEKAAMIARDLTGVDRPGFDPADVAAGEKLLTDDARLFGPESLRQLVQRVVEAINPDGSRPDEDPQQDRRTFTMAPTKDGRVCGGVPADRSLRGETPGPAPTPVEAPGRRLRHPRHPNARHANLRTTAARRVGGPV